MRQLTLSNRRPAPLGHQRPTAIPASVTSAASPRGTGRQSPPRHRTPRCTRRTRRRSRRSSRPDQVPRARWAAAGRPGERVKLRRGSGRSSAERRIAEKYRGCTYACSGRHGLRHRQRMGTRLAGPRCSAHKLAELSLSGCTASGVDRGGQFACRN
jgi:hypothetical protein